MSTQIISYANAKSLVIPPDAKIIDLIDTALQKLVSAKGIAQKADVALLMQKIRQFAEITQVTSEAKVSCLYIEAMAKIQTVEEYDRAKERGEVADRRDGPLVRDLARDEGEIVPTLPELGLDSRRLAEWRKMAELGAEFVGDVLRQALDEGREPTQADIKRAVSGNVGTHALKAFSGNNEYYTPARYIEAAREVMGDIDLDPASCEMAQRAVKAKKYYTIEDDGLTQPWFGKI